MTIVGFEGDAVWLDYDGADRRREILENLSGVAVAGDYLWTVSDEGRSIECLAPHRSGYRLRKQYDLDSLFEDLPGAEGGDEADIESIDVAAGRLWICGSHCRVRRQLKKTGDTKVDPRFRSRPSRRLLGALRLSDDGGEVLQPGDCLPFSGKSSLRKLLAESAFIEPFLGLPSKENGLDIEGLLVFRNRLLLGLRARSWTASVLWPSWRTRTRSTRPISVSFTLSILRDWACGTSQGGTTAFLFSPVRSARPMGLFASTPGGHAGRTMSRSRNSSMSSGVGQVGPKGYALTGAAGATVFSFCATRTIRSAPRGHAIAPTGSGRSLCSRTKRIEYSPMVSGYEKSPDYGGPEPTWGNVVVEIAVVVAIIVAVVAIWG